MAPERTGEQHGPGRNQPPDRQQPPARRGDRGRFAPGQSGNPRGRPKGSRDKRTVALAALLDGGAHDVVKGVVEAAKLGEQWAVRLVVDRVLPKTLERRLNVEVPAVEKAEDVARAVAAVIDLAASGELTVEEAQAFLRLLEHQRKTIETSDLSVRLALIEEQSREGL